MYILKSMLFKTVKHPRSYLVDVDNVSDRWIGSGLLAFQFPRRLSCKTHRKHHLRWQCHLFQVGNSYCALYRTQHIMKLHSQLQLFRSIAHVRIPFFVARSDGVFFILYFVSIKACTKNLTIELNFLNGHVIVY